MPSEFEDIIYAPIVHTSKASIFQKIFFRSCRRNIPGVYSFLSSHLNLVSVIHEGIAIALEYGAIDCILKLLSLTEKIDISWLILSVQRGYPKAVHAIIQHKSFDVKNLIPMLPIPLYDDKKPYELTEIFSILFTIPELKGRELLKFYF